MTLMIDEKDYSEAMMSIRIAGEKLQKNEVSIKDFLIELAEISSKFNSIRENAETFSDDEIKKLVWCYEVDTHKTQKDAYGIKEIIEKLKRFGG